MILSGFTKIATVIGSISSPVKIILGVITAITALTAAYKHLNPTIEEQKKNLDELKSKYTSVTEELSTLNAQIEENEKLIIELKDKYNDGTITLVEEDQIKKLKLQNSLLREQLKLKEDTEKQGAEDLAGENRETFINEFGGSVEDSYVQSTMTADTYAAKRFTYENEDTTAKELVLLLKANDDLLKQAVLDGNESLIEVLETDKNNITNELTERSTSILDGLLAYQDNLMLLMNEDGTFEDPNDQQMWDWIEGWKKEIRQLTNSSGEWNTIQIETALDDESLVDIQNELIQKLKDGTLTEEDINKYPVLVEALKNINLIIQNGQTPASIYLQYLKGIAETGNEINALDEPKIFKFDEVLEQLKESYTTLHSLKEEVDESGKVSVDTIQDIMSKYPGLTNLLSDYVEGKVDEKALINSLSEEYEIDLENYKLYIAQKNGEDEEFYDQIVSNLSEDLIKKAESYGIELGNYSNYLEAKLVMDKEYARKKAMLDSATEQYESTVTDTTHYLNPSLSAYDNMEEAKQEVADIEEIIAAVDTAITLTIPDFNTDLFKTDKPDKDKAKEFSDSIDWAANSISNLEREISKLNNTISNTEDIDKRIKLLKQLKSQQEDLVTLRKNTRGEYKDRYDESLKELTPAQRKKYQALIESDTAFNVQDFEGEKEEVLFNKLTNSQSLWQAYQQADVDYKTAKQDVKDTEQLISDTDVLERSKQIQEGLEKELDTVNEKLNNSTLSTEEKNDLLEQQYNLQKSINDELRVQATHEGDTETVAKLDAEDKNNEYEYYSSIYDSNKEGLTRDIEKNDNQIKDIQNAIDLAGKGTVEQYEDIISLQGNSIGRWETQAEIAKKMRDDNKDNLVLYQFWDNELQDCEDNIHAMESGIKEMRLAILNLPLQEVELKLQSINKEINSQNRELETQTELINAAIAVFDEQIETQNLIKEGIQDRIDALQEEHDLRNANLNVQKSQYELEKAKNNKTTKVFREGVGFVFEADQEAVQEAQLNYDNAIYERKIQLLNEEIKRVDKNIESLTKQKKQWEDIIPLMERAALVTKAEAYDMDFKNKVLTGNVGLLTTIRDRYGEIYDEIGTLEETKEPYELLQEELTDISQLFSLDGISYEEALERTKSTIEQYYPELLTKYDEQKTSLDEVAKKQLEGVGVTEETSEDNLEEIKITNEEITQSYNDLLLELTDVFGQLEALMATFSAKAMAVASSVVSSVSTISSAISTAGSVVDSGVNKIGNTFPKEYQKVDDKTLDMYYDIAKNLNTSLLPKTTSLPVGVLSPITTNNNKATSVSFGDIIVNDVKNPTDFAKTIVTSLSNAMKQELYK